MKCPVCHNELIHIYKIGYCHPAYSDCFDGLNLATKKSDDGTEVVWFEVNDIEGRAYFLRKIAEIEKLEGKEPVEKVPEKPDKAETKSFFKQVEEIIKEAPKEPKKETKRFATRFKEVFTPYYEEDQKRLE